MTGGEIAAVGKAIEVVGKKAFGQDEKTTGQLLRAAEGTPEFESAARARAARIAVKERIKLKLYQPFALMLGVSKAYFEDVFPEEMAAKTASIPDEHMITPPASVAVPALQGLSYSFGEPDLKELYLNLLTTATDDRRTEDAHPAFADVIKQLSPREAKPLNELLAQVQVPAARLKDVDESYNFQIKLTHLLPYTGDTDQPVELPQMPAWVDNWVRLGLVEANYLNYLTGDSAYDWVTARPEYLRISQEPGIRRLDFEKGFIGCTAFGKRFFRAVAPLAGSTGAP